MIGFVKRSTILAILLLSATFAYAGDLKAVHGGGTSVHPAPQGSKETGKQMVSEHAQSTAAVEAVNKTKDGKLRPLKDGKLRAVK